MKALLALLIFVSVAGGQQFDAWVRTDDTLKAKIAGFRVVMIGHHWFSFGTTNTPYRDGHFPV